MSRINICDACLAEYSKNTFERKKKEIMELNQYLICFHRYIDGKNQNKTSEKTKSQKSR